MDYRKKEHFKCQAGIYTKVAQTIDAVAWKVEEPGGTVAYEVWKGSKRGWSRMPLIEDYGKTAFYTRDEADVRFWMREIERSGR